MRPFSKVSPQMWNQKTFKGLPSSDAKLLMLYFLTGPHQNSAGCYRLPDGYAAADLGWDIPRYVEAREAVIAAELIAFDGDTSELYVRGWFELNPITNDKHKIGSERIIDGLESSELNVLAGDELEASEAELVKKPKRAKSASDDR